MGKAWKCRLNPLLADIMAYPCDACTAPELCGPCPKQIVIVDDDHDCLEAASEFFDFSGFVVHPHASPYEAMSFMKAHDFDVLLSDIEMPGMRGTQLAAWLSDRRPEIQVILISGLDIPPTEIYDGWSFFRKPVDFTLIQLAIERH